VGPQIGQIFLTTYGKSVVELSAQNKKTTGKAIWGECLLRGKTGNEGTKKVAEKKRIMV